MKKKYIPYLLMALAAALIYGCILTGTVVITALAVPDPDPVTVNETTFMDGEIEIDLNGISEFEDYKDNIRDIDNVAFYLSVHNNQATDVNFQLLIDPDTSNNWPTLQDAIVDGIDVLFSGLLIPGNKTVIIDWDESISYTSQIDDIKNILKDGIFSLYPAAIPREDFSVTIDSCVAVITLTGAK